MKVSVIIPAAGSGKRFGSPENKIFLDLAGKSVIERTAMLFSSLSTVTEILLVGNSTDLPRLREMFSGHRLVKILLGGAERFDSVWAALQQVNPESEIVLIHDAARPLTNPSLIRSVIESAKEKGAAIAAIPLVDSIKRSLNGETILESVDRETLYAAQTPQAFQLKKFLESYQKAIAENFRASDDAGVAQRYGMTVSLVPGEKQNLKITKPEDLEFARFFIANQNQP